MISNFDGPPGILRYFFLNLHTTFRAGVSSVLSTTDISYNIRVLVSIKERRGFEVLRLKNKEMYQSFGKH